ncbi:hypothetical protein [Reichenbachiella versicolor]|uniref:hypothetical protein n=1 Tax=Reichenbachiella versicolor TaxID=1821036 RepID=UPI0013A5B24A|nr:hypothetical protein [Reichenbachiella versicolor]
MKYSTQLLILIHSLLLSLSLSAQNDDYTPPKAIVGTSEFFGGMYPVGWSQDEYYFAWIRYNTDTGEADPPQGYFFKLIIQDVRSDKEVYNRTIFGSDLCGDKDCRFTQESIWQNYGQELNTKLREYGIVQDKNIKLLKFPLSANGMTYDIKLDFEKSNYGENQNEEISIKSDLGSKVIYNKTYNQPNQPNPPLESEVRGGFLSPSSKRAVIVKESKYRGFEDERLLLPTLIGAHLIAGFKK